MMLGMTPSRSSWSDILPRRAFSGNKAFRYGRGDLYLFAHVNDSTRTFPSPIITPLTAQKTKSETSPGVNKCSGHCRPRGYTRGVLEMLLRSGRTIHFAPAGIESNFHLGFEPLSICNGNRMSTHELTLHLHGLSRRLLCVKRDPRLAFTLHPNSSANLGHLAMPRE